MKRILVIQKQKYSFIDEAISRLCGKFSFHSTCDLKNLPDLLNSLDFDLILVDSEHRIAVIQYIYASSYKKAILIFNPFVSKEKKCISGNLFAINSILPVEFKSSDNIEYQINEIIDSAQNNIPSKNCEIGDDIKSEILANVSHELRTPLAIIKESVEVISDKLIGDVNDAQEHFLSISLRNIERLANIINRLLEMSGIEKKDIKINCRRVNLFSVMEKIYREIKPGAEKKSISIEIDITDNLPEIETDEKKIRQILSNIMENAVKFSNNGGSIYFGAYRVHNSIEIFIKDTGRGIPEEELPRIFNKFHQVRRTAGPGERGTGLGLSISKKLIEMLNGSIQVKSEVGIGTTFVVRLPVNNDKNYYI